MEKEKQEKQTKKRKKKNGILKKISIAFIIIVFIVAVVSIGIYFKPILFNSKTTKLGFENIGEFATQSAYCTQVNSIDAPRELWGIAIPFTQSRYIYSYDVVIKAGLDFEKIRWSVNENNVIEVILPEIKILSNEVIQDSLEIFLEDESIYRQITLEENNQAIIEMKQDAEKKAIENGLFEHARTNAEMILTGFFSNEYDLEEYKIEFTYE